MERPDPGREADYDPDMVKLNYEAATTITILQILSLYDHPAVVLIVLWRLSTILLLESGRLFLSRCARPHVLSCLTPPHSGP
jgi:hypothetical protein